MDNEGIIGTCVLMCPEAEIRERENARLIHYLERSDNQNQPAMVESMSGSSGPWRSKRGGRGQQHSNGSSRGLGELVKADKNKAVKSYTRPAAGVNKTTPSDLRPPEVLKKTVAYLCLKVLTRTDLPFIDVYDFVFDRLRAVRQDMVIQRICDESAILILEAIVKFHLYAEHRFRKDTPVNYDPMINQKHLRDCLKSLLSYYGMSSFNGPTRPFFEALYLLGSPESYEVISRAFKIKTEMEDSPVFSDALEICLAIQNKNFYKFFKLLDELPPLLAGYVIQHVPFMRIHALRTLALAYGVKTCKIPLEWIKDLLSYPNLSQVEKDVMKIGSKIVRSEDGSGDKFVNFDKSSPNLKTDCEIHVSIDVDFLILTGLKNLDIIAAEQICRWGRDL